MWAVLCGREEVVEVLLAHPDVDVTCRGSADYTALHWACRFSSVGIVRRLLAMPGVQVDARNITGRTPLMEAVEEGGRRKEAVRVMVDVEGIDLDARNITGRTPLMEAVEEGG